MGQTNIYFWLGANAEVWSIGPFHLSSTPKGRRLLNGLQRSLFGNTWPCVPFSWCPLKEHKGQPRKSPSSCLVPPPYGTRFDCATLRF